MVLYPILSLLIDPPLSFVHSDVVISPLLPENLPLDVNLIFEVVTELVKLILEFVLKLVDHIMDVIHAVDGIFPILGNFSIRVIEFLFHLPLIFNSGVFKDLESR